jgi:ATP-dependent RNA helicase RhlE
MSFKTLGLSANLLQGIQSMGYADPTPVQLRSIPSILEGKDLIGSAQTGTGKTAAFALPALQRLGQHGRLRCLVLEPTRELAAQVETAFRNIGRFTDLRSTALFGGVGYGNQRKALQQGMDIVVATPGRLEDHLKQRTMHLREIEILILDEVDRMLDIGFLPIVKKLVGMCPKERQTLFFSATVPPEIADLAKFALHNPVRVEIGATRSVTSTVTHGIYKVSQSLKFDLLLALLDSIDFQSVIIFSRTKHGADKIAKKLKAANHTVAVLHSNRSQNQRIEALNGFKSGKYEVMVATDIAARGIDIAGVSHVINYDIPEHPEDYVHRIGRTGRAEKVGDAFTLVTHDDFKKLRAIERFIGQKIEQLQLAGFTPPKDVEPGQNHDANNESLGQRKSSPHQSQGGGGNRRPRQKHRRPNPNKSSFVNAKGEQTRRRR